MPRSSPAQPGDERAPRREAARGVVICDPTCTWMATSVSDAPAGQRREQLARRVERHAELVDLEAGRDVRMALGVDVGIDADGDARRRARVASAIASMRASSPADSTLIAFSPSGTAHSSSAADLPTPVNTMSRRREARALRATSISQIELASAALPSVAQQARDRQRRVGLERVVQRVRIVAECVVDRAVPLRGAARRCRRRAACRRRRRWPTAERRRRRGS